jgi:peptidyl-prolyl cis-trans isomerase D
LMPASTTLALPIKTTGLFTKKGGANGMAANPKIIKATFSDAVLKQSYNSNPLEIAPGDMVVLRIKQHIPESTLPLAEVSKAIEQRLKMKKMHAAVKKVAEAVMTALQNKQNPQDLSKKYAVEWQIQSKVGRKDNRIDNRIVQAAFALPKPKNAVSVVPAVALVDLADKGYAVVQSKSVYDGYVKQVDAKQLKIIQDKLQADWSAFEYDLLVGQVLKQAKVKIEKTVAADVSEAE